MEIAVGTRVYNTGDMANADHFGTVVSLRGHNVEIRPEDDNLYAAGETYWVSRCMFGEYTGTCSPRMTTEESYRAFRVARIRAFTGGGA